MAQPRVKLYTLSTCHHCRAAKQFLTETSLPVTEVALIWPPRTEGDALRPMLDVVFGRHAPNRVVAGAVDGHGHADLPLLAGRGSVDGQPTAYVCRHYVCELPTSDPGTLAGQLDAAV